MKKYLKIGIITIGIFSITSCSKWLEVTPKGQVEASDLLTTTEGYCKALSGIYYTMMQTNLYGGDMTYGFMDALAQYWPITSKTHPYYDATQYSYTSTKSQGQVNTFWSKFYLIIAQSNQILESLDAQEPGKIQHYDLIKGELLGLRAFAHMQLLGLFGPVVQNTGDLDLSAIAYRTEFNPTATKFNTVKEVLGFVKADLTAALGLLKDDPIKVNGRRGNGNTSSLNYHDVLDRRGSRMNYFALLGLLAREEQLALNQTEAYNYARRLLDEIETTTINSFPIFRFTPKDNIAGTNDAQRDIRFSDEMIFSIYINNLSDIVGPIFGYDKYDLNQSSYLTIDFGVVTNFVYGRTPDGSGTDYRLNYWFGKSTVFNNFYMYTKLKPATKMSGLPDTYAPEISLMRLPEIYYILCESLIGKDNSQALKYLNDVRVSRGLQPLTDTFSETELKDYLIREQRKEFFGEGRMFFVYKRLFRDMEVSQGVTVKALPSIFTLPIPDDEYEFSPNEKK